jgi:threonine synthase
MSGKRVVTICTGHGLKDPDIIVKQFHQPTALPPELRALEDAILAA